MRQAVVKLESFYAESAAERAARLSAEVAGAAYQKGLADGRAAQASGEAADLTAAMRDLAAELAGEDSRRHDLRRDAVAALAPLLSAIVDAMAPMGQSERLERCLLDEMTRLAQMTSPLHCRILCAPEMRPLVERCAGVAGLTAFEIVDAPLGQTLHLTLQGGQIEFSHDAAAEAIRALIHEIQED